MNEIHVMITIRPKWIHSVSECNKIYVSCMALCRKPRVRELTVLPETQTPS